MKNTVRETIAILGGTGKEGKGLAYRWAKTGYKVLIGSRTPPKAIDTAEELARCWTEDHASKACPILMPLKVQTSWS